MTVGALFACVPGLAVSSDAAECAVLSGDIAAPATHPAGAVLRPSHQEQVVDLVRAARREGVRLYPRGGGWSYTGGFAPNVGPAALVDCTGLDGVAIDRDGGVASVGAGVTWAVLHDTLAAAGLRARSFGPLSGLGATVGGGAAQNGGFFGAAAHGAFGDGGICGGTLVDGTGAMRELTPEDRADGSLAPQPLVGDCGAFGIRTRVVVRTMPMPTATQFASFDFRDGAAAFAVLASLAGRPGLGEAYVFDPGTHANLARTGFSVIESATMAGDLLRGPGGLFARLGGLARTARAKALVGELHWSLHVSVDGSETEATAGIEAVARRALAAGGEAIPDVIPRVTRARPFRRIKALLGPDGEVWLPLHGVFPAERAAAGLAAAQAVLAEAGADMAAHGVRCVMLGVLMGRRVIVEPQLSWHDALSAVHRRLAQPDQVAAYGGRAARPEARACALALRKRLTAALDSAGAEHFQIGRTYAGPAGARASWLALKARFDPDGIMNPGVLGL